MRSRRQGYMDRRAEAGSACSRLYKFKLMLRSNSPSRSGRISQSSRSLILIGMNQRVHLPVPTDEQYVIAFGFDLHPRFLTLDEKTGWIDQPHLDHRSRDRSIHSSCQSVDGVNTALVLWTQPYIQLRDDVKQLNGSKKLEIACGTLSV